MLAVMMGLVVAAVFLTWMFASEVVGSTRLPTNTTRNQLKDWHETKRGERDGTHGTDL